MPHNLYKTRTITCISCGKEVTKRMPLGRKYCSLDCYRTSKRPQCKTGEIIKCKFCGEEKYFSKCRIDNKHDLFCSVDCSEKYQARNKIKFCCKVCNNDFYVSKSTEKNHGRKPKYCSIDCRNKDKDWAKNSYIRANLIQSKRKGLNKLELAGNDILNDLELSYKCQCLLFEKFLVDVFIPDKNIVIQWDGDYWHGHISKLKDGIPDKRQKKRMCLDKSQDAYMKKAGMIVLRFWEHDVNKNKEIVIDTIKRAI